MLRKRSDRSKCGEAQARVTK
ncbi:TraY domain-containing protein [Leptospira sp. id769339]|nr:TraY domain-containing protein [Leptospira sp. id769339]